MSVRATVHLACGDVTGLLRQAPEPVQWLADSEARRLAGIKTEERRLQFLAARWQARWLLAQVLGGRPQDWALEAPPDAPPRVRGRDDLYLSVSHSGQRSACALAAGPVGLDLEQPRRPRDLGGLVEFVCTPRERQVFATLAAGEREAFFYELWTVKEAWLKRRGEWIAPRRLAQIEAGAAPDGEFCTWRGDNWHLAVSARPVRWWTEQPGLSGTWSIVDRS